MLLIHCPYCGRRDRSSNSATAAKRISRARPDIAAESDEDWANFLYLRANPKGVHRERWRHMHGCGRFFNACATR